MKYSSWIQKNFPALYRRWRNINAVRDDNLAMLRSFLAGCSYAARSANICFNGICTSVRLFKRIRRLMHPKRHAAWDASISLPACTQVPRLAARCLLIAETSISQCLHYRVQERVRQLRLLGWKTTFCSWHDFATARRQLQLATCVIFYRVPMFPPADALFAEARRLHLPIFFDIDDYIFAREPSGQYLERLQCPDKERKGLLDLADAYLAAMNAADVLLSSTRTLSGLLPYPERHADNIVHNTVADALVQISLRERSLFARDDGIVRIFYGSGSATHDRDFALIADALREALERDPRIHLYLMGHIAPPPCLDSCERVHRIGFLDKKTYYRLISEYDIALMPLEETLFNDAKSNIKYLEASALGLSSIVSPCAEFVDAVTDGVDGIIARTHEEWRDAILKLAASPELRVSMGRKARQNVLERYSCARVAKQELRPLLPSVAPDHRLRVLLVNMLFGMASFGGATMIVEDTARALQKEDIDVHIFSTIRSEKIPVNDVLRYEWQGVNVISVNMCPGNEYITSDILKKTFCKALQSVRPHVVHFHCIQGLGIGLVMECQRRGIPYVLTMHDAWWLCPRQFMLDTTNTYCAQQVVRPETCVSRCHLHDAEVYSRRFAINDAVKGAARIFAPSAFYTDFVRRNFPSVAERCHVNKNGIRWTRVDAPAVPQKGDPLRLGFLGGKTAHKGYFFLAKALRALGRADFELLLVDVHTAFGSAAMDSQEDKELWQGLPVRILPFIQHDEMDTFYAQIDVLLFPSLWDESFGLTVREAILHHVFVIASQCGGPCEGIVPGKNGLLFPKGDEEAFCRHLHFVLNNQERFRAYQTTDFGDIITVETQARELAEVYREIGR